MGFLNVNDTLSGKEARAYANINGRNIALFYLKKVEAKIKKNKKGMNVLGNRAEQYKATGWSGSGTMTLYYITSEFRALMLDYIKTGKDTYFDLTFVNDDPSSDVGVQTVILKRCNLDEIPITLIDVDNEALEEDLTFTFSDVDMPDKFKEAEQLG